MAESKPVVVSKAGFPLKKGEIRIEVGETSQGRDQLVISADQMAQTQRSLSIEDWFRVFDQEEENDVRTISKTPHETQSDLSISEKRFKMFEKINEGRMYKIPKIQKVKFSLRDHKHFVKYYEPRVVSFGPIHHGKEMYLLAEMFKLKLAKLFVTSTGKTIKELFNKIEKNIKELREYFEEGTTEKYNDADLAWILVVDGCAILQYIYLAVEIKFEELNIKHDSVAFWHQDLFLLENQVPYRLLEELMSLSPMKEKLEKSIDIFIEINWNMNQQYSSQEQAGESGESIKPIHLLDLLRISLLGLARKPKEGQKRSRRQKDNPDWQSFPNTQELIAAGIHVKRSEDNSLRGISFSRKFNCFFPGILSLPPLIVDDSTGPKFLNLIAYEMCPDFQNDFGITSYITFLYSLINEANDVKELRKARVLFNFLVSDEEVARLFNEIGTDLVPNIGEYEDVMGQIQKHFCNKIMFWMGALFHDIFSRPWRIVAFLGSLSALVLTATPIFYSPHGPCDDFCKKFT